MAICLIAFVNASNFYEQSLSTMDNRAVNFHRFEGKRVMIVVLPLGSDATFSDQIATLAASQRDSLVIIGVPGVETGYSDTLKERVKALYADEPDNFILTSGMHISKASGQHQAPVFQWLTDSKRNGFFDRDALEAG